MDPENGQALTMFWMGSNESVARQGDVRKNGVNGEAK